MGKAKRKQRGPQCQSKSGPLRCTSPKGHMGWHQAPCGTGLARWAPKAVTPSRRQQNRNRCDPTSPALAVELRHAVIALFELETPLGPRTRT